jgi:phosphoribosyl-dephospho-CoA transferase
MPALRRHQLVRLNAAGWASIRDCNWDADARACLEYWAGRNLPLVVTQQRGGLPAGAIALGLPAPRRWQRRRLALQVPVSGVFDFDEFPKPESVGKLLPQETRDALLTLLDIVSTHGSEMRVYGSYGWQQVTGLDYLRAESDLDLRMLVQDAHMADLVAETLGSATFARPRLDGELIFPDGSAVAWREWLAWRSKQADLVLVKRLSGVVMERDALWLKAPHTC